MLAIEHSSCIPIISDTPTMILGIDVSHGSSGRSDMPSISAVCDHPGFCTNLFANCQPMIISCLNKLQVVGSRCWPLISQYRASIRAQSPKLEIIDALYKPLVSGEDDGIMRYQYVLYHKRLSVNYC